MENDTTRANSNDIETEGTNTVFDDDDLDAAVGAADDTGMVSQQQYVVKTEEQEALGES
jgi:hypothetical protein